MQDLGLQLWIEWFKWSGNPWVDSDYGRTSCFFCVEESPNHSADCIFIKVQTLLAVQQEVQVDECSVCHETQGLQTYLLCEHHASELLSINS